MLKLLASYSLIFSLLIANLQVPLFLHTCNVFEITTTSIYSEETCVDEPMTFDGEAISFDCCSLEVKNMKADLVTNLAKLIKKDLQMMASAFIHEVVQLAFQAETEQPAAVRPPPEHFFNTTLLHFIQVLRL